MSEDEGSITYGIVTLLIGVLLLFRFVFYYMLINQFVSSVNAINWNYYSTVYSNFQGTIDIMMGLFGFIAGGVLMAERGGAAGLFLVVWIYSLWTSIVDLIGLFTMASFLPGALPLLIINIVLLIVCAAILVIALARSGAEL